eukprot:TRINITY_DN20779_c0_g1_i4.p2 TRINITY_DN20779_c0_g1~~TRINITY_DN20779_c0_g1_i4.p2  ORF type:complete len:108 (+),score=24.94 TRINITY_DN20779_c0_g1_i4:77-400(+)
MIRRPPRSTLSSSSAASDVYKRQPQGAVKKEHGQMVCLQYIEYVCGYCGTRKVSTSIGRDGRVRIRCDCGGKHSDGVPRMHAKWSLCNPPEQLAATQSPPLKRAKFQ